MRGCPVRDTRGGGEVDTETDDDAVALPLEEDSSDFRAAGKQVVRPFQQQREARRGRVERLDEGQPRNEREGLGRGVASGDRNQRASEEIAALGYPVTALASFSCRLLQGYQPVALERGAVGKKIGIGRARGLDDPDPGQSKTPAARSARLPSGPIRR